MNRTFRMLAGLLAACAIPTANAALSNVTNLVTVTKSPLAYNRAAKTFDALISVRNTGRETLLSPIYLMVTGLPETASVNSAADFSPDGKPMVLLPVGKSGLMPGAAVTNVAIRFHNPARDKFDPVLRVLSYTGAKLPPDPGQAGKATLAGVDYNRNWVRDDVEVYIARNFGHSERLVQALNDYAVAAQRGILSTNSQESLQAANLLGRAIECLMHVAPSDGDAGKSIQSASINTPARFAAWLRYQDRLAGSVLGSRPVRQWATSCSFQPEMLRN
ncbi:hypothetical protein [Pseudoduganella umbonata]|uniref:Uncharacterized protein n=1 Tax=Pseudoduganella umbonata TaxID=864828 RepID=A0A4P8HZL7_9BURK|nr:hypothetical protein [Pseudoduganella umbonata]MBB3223956.1 hypothetical protein [Pseudoduganella umbonata]QCP14160.1 hypothetical protein FCL38_29910 [Pseudoduganella umbonata]